MSKPSLKLIRHTEFHDDTCDSCKNHTQYTGHLCQNSECKRKLCRTVEHDDGKFGGKCTYTCYQQVIDPNCNLWVFCKECYDKFKEFYPMVAYDNK